MTVGWSKKPCPVCHEHEGYSLKEGACWECLKLIEDGRKYREQTKVGKKRIVVAHFISAPHWNPTYHYITYDRDRDLERQLQEAIGALVVAVSDSADEKQARGDVKPLLKKFPRRGQHHGYNNMVSFDSKSCWVMPKSARDAISNLDTVIRKVLKYVHEDGKEDGSSLIHQLREGEITLLDYEEQRKPRTRR